MGKFEKLTNYRNPWLLNWLKSPDKFYTLFVAWVIYALVSRLFGLNYDYPGVYKLISRLMFWPSVLFGAWNVSKPALYRYLYSEEMPVFKPSITEEQTDMQMEERKNEEAEGHKDEKPEIKPGKKSVTDRELLKYFWDTLMGKTSASAKDSVYALIFMVSAFIFFSYLNDFSAGENMIISAILAIIFLFNLTNWQYYHSPEVQVKREEVKEIVSQSQKLKSSHPYLKALIYFMAFSFIISTLAAFINREPTEKEFELMTKKETQTTFYVKSSSANVRACPSTSCAVLYTVPQNHTYELPYLSVKEFPEDYWFDVDFTLQSGKSGIGYISGSILSDTPVTAAISASPTLKPTVTITQKPTVTVSQEPTSPIQPAPQPTPAPAQTQNISFNSARCSVAPGYAWPPKSSGGGGIFLGVPINLELDATVSGPLDSVLNLTGSGFPKLPRLWTKKLPCWTAGTSCSVYQQVSGDPSNWKFTLPSETSAKSPESFPVLSRKITIRLGYQDPKYGNDVMLLDNLITKNATIEVTSCESTGSDLSTGSPCECRIIEQ